MPEADNDEKNEQSDLEKVAMGLIDSVAAGRLTEDNLAVAAGLGHPAAIFTGVAPIPFGESYAFTMTSVGEELSCCDAVSLLMRCVSRCIDAWRSYSDDSKIPNAFQELLRWPASDLAVRLPLISELAWDASLALDCPGLTLARNPERVRAKRTADAVSAAANALLAAHPNEVRNNIEFSRYFAHAMRFAAGAAVDEMAERKIQMEMAADCIVQSHHSTSGTEFRTDAPLPPPPDRKQTP